MSRSAREVVELYKDRTRADVGSIEIFRVLDGRIVEVWNCGYKQGVWR